MRGAADRLREFNEGTLIEQYASLAGTERNCAGGPTPWRSWMTCEEPLFFRSGVRHGYVLEVPAVGMSDADPLVRLGRFNHEAAAIDPAKGVVYETEDRPDSLFYRFVPAAYGDLKSPGKLQALRLVDWPEGVATRRPHLLRESICLHVHEPHSLISSQRFFDGHSGVIRPHSVNSTVVSMRKLDDAERRSASNTSSV